MRAVLQEQRSLVPDCQIPPLCLCLVRFRKRLVTFGLTGDVNSGENRVFTDVFLLQAH